MVILLAAIFRLQDPPNLLLVDPKLNSHILLIISVEKDRVLKEKNHPSHKGIFLGHCVFVKLVCKIRR